MSVVSVNPPWSVGVSASESPIEVPAPGRSPNELDGYKESMGEAGAVGKRRDPISGNARRKIWMRPELSVFSNSEYAYAIYPIAICLFLGKGGKEIPDSTHWLWYLQFSLIVEIQRM